MTKQSTIDKKKMPTHNKKRNAGLVVEFLMKRVSDAVLVDDRVRANAAIKLLRKRVRSGTELYKEYKIINSLVNSTVDCERTARAVLDEAKRCSLSRDMGAMNSELSRLISEVNREGLNEDGCLRYRVSARE